MYVYAADTWCDSCGEKIRADLTCEGSAPADPSDEYAYDSDEFPKGPYPEESTDGPDHCASRAECLEAVDLGDYGLEDGTELIGAEGRRIGALLSDGLTDEGVSYLQEMMEDRDREPTSYQVALYRFWREVFAGELAAV